MKRSRFAEDQIIGILKEAEAGAKTVKTHRMTTPPINRSTCYIDGKIAGIDGVAFRATNDSHHEVETASETFAYDVSRRGRIWENVHIPIEPQFSELSLYLFITFRRQTRRLPERSKSLI
jgi:hypothetical protein